MRTLNQVDITNKKVLLRVDYNVPLDKNGDIVDDFKIRKGMPTLKYILKKAKQVLILTHMGRPEGKVDPKLKTDKLALYLMKHLTHRVTKVNDCVDVEIPDDKVVMLENVRFHREETDNDEVFATKLASLADVYVNDAFGVSYNKHASIVGVPKVIPSCAGLLIEKEVQNLDFSKIERPFAVIIGGAKFSNKFPAINALLPKVDKLLIGGAMIFTFFKAKGYEIGKSLYEEEQVLAAKLLLNNEKIILPNDVVVASEAAENSKEETVDEDKIPRNKIGLDVGEKTIEKFKKELKGMKTIFWNGPLGMYEIDKFGKSSEALAKFLAGCKAKTIIGGGDSITVINKLELKDEYDYISTGGGATLEFIKSGTLVGLEALKK
ncbi:phosphoglycerate kinase [Bacteroidota bacterium]